MSSIRTEYVTVAAVALALAAYPILPVLAWIAPFALLAFYLAGKVRVLPGSDRKWITLCCATAALFQLASLAIHHSYDPRSTTTWLDDQNYYTNAARIAQAWSTGFFPELSRKGSPPYLGTLHTGYERILGAVFYVTGPSFRAGLVVNLIAVSVLPLLLFLLTDTLFHGLSPKEENAGQKLPPLALVSTPPRMAALLTALYPSTYYWGSHLLKDVLLAFLFVAALLALVDTLRVRRAAPALLFVLLLFWTAIFRAYAALSLAAAACLYPFAALRRSALLWGMLYGAIAVVLLSYTEGGGRYMDQLLASFGALIPREMTGLRPVLFHFGSALPRMLLAPYAWVRAEGPDPIYALYPGMWYLYLVTYPLAAAGIVRAVRQDHRLSLVPIVALLASAFVLLAAYGGNAPRQRLYLEFVALAYAGLGAHSRKLPAFLVVWSMVFLFAAAQLIRLYMRG